MYTFPPHSKESVVPFLAIRLRRGDHNFFGFVLTMMFFFFLLFSFFFLRKKLKGRCRQARPPLHLRQYRLAILANITHNKSHARDEAAAEARRQDHPGIHVQASYHTKTTTPAAVWFTRGAAHGTPRLSRDGVCGTTRQNTSRARALSPCQ